MADRATRGERHSYTTALLIWTYCSRWKNTLPSPSVSKARNLGSECVCSFGTLMTIKPVSVSLTTRTLRRAVAGADQLFDRRRQPGGQPGVDVARLFEE